MNLGIEMVAAILGLALGLPLVLLYKRLVADRGEARQGFADLDVQLKRRVELAPRLLETVRGHASREKAVLSAVTGLRSAILSAPGVLERLGHEIDLGAELRKLIGLQEAYPPLRADPDFRELSTKLAEIEEQLEFARRSYNDAVMQYVKRLESFPDEIVAKLFGFEPMPFFESDARGSARKKKSASGTNQEKP
jgi:LemA protein